MGNSIYAVFGDLHGRVLPAFKLTGAWARQHGVSVNGILQVGDLGYFPDTSRLDKATFRYAADDPFELGIQLVTQPNHEADIIFNDSNLPAALWFTAGNHEDFEALESLAHGRGSRKNIFPVDAYGRVHCIRDGFVASLSGDIRVGALWGIACQARKSLPTRACIRAKSAHLLRYSSMNVLLTHDGPMDAVRPDFGSEEIEAIIHSANPSFAFFGLYSGPGCQALGNYGRTEVYHLAGMELRRRNKYPEEGCMGILRWFGDTGEFRYVDANWLMNYPRTEWRYWSNSL